MCSHNSIISILPNLKNKNKKHLQKARFLCSTCVDKSSKGLNWADVPWCKRIATFSLFYIITTDLHLFRQFKWKWHKHVAKLQKKSEPKVKMHSSTYMPNTLNNNNNKWHSFNSPLQLHHHQQFSSQMYGKGSKLQMQPFLATIML